MMVTISIPSKTAQRIREEARRLGVSVEEYVLELITQGLDPRVRAVEYIEAAEELVGRAGDELERGDVRQAAEKVWGAAALAVKAYAWWRDRRRLTSHRELWEYKDVMADELGEWVNHVWNEAGGMHTCFYEGWCTERSVRAALKQVERLVKEVSARINRR